MPEASSVLSVEVHSSLDAGGGAATALMRANENLFATPEWGSAWLDHLSDGHPPLVAIVRRSDGSPAGLLALVTSREAGVRVARLLGHGPADRLAPICRDKDRTEVADALAGLLTEIDCDLFIGQQMPVEEGWAEALGAQVILHEPSPAIAIRGLDWDGYLARRSRNFRQQVRRRERKLAEHGSLAFRLSDDPDRLDADLDTLIGLHEERWQGRSSAFAGPLRGFHAQFARRALDRGWLRLWLLELDGRPLAAWYGFRYANAEWYYQSGRSLDAAAENVGFVLLAHTIREAINDGCSEYRMLRGGEAYKARFADCDAGLETVVVPLTFRGRRALAVNRMRGPAGRALRFLHLR